MRVFISYRRRTWPFTHRLAEHLRARIRGGIFVDIDSIDEDDFEQSILGHLRNSDAFLLIVSPETFDPERIHREGDWVRREIAEALKLDLPIVLVLVDGRSPPQLEELPADIQEVARKQGIEFYPAYFEAGVHRLATFLRRVVRARRKEMRSPHPRALTWGIGIGGGVALLALALVLVDTFGNRPEPASELTETSTVEEVRSAPTATTIPADAPGLTPTTSPTPTHTPIPSHTPLPTSTATPSATATAASAATPTPHFICPQGWISDYSFSCRNELPPTGPGNEHGLYSHPDCGVDCSNLCQEIIGELGDWCASAGGEYQPPSGFTVYCRTDGGCNCYLGQCMVP